MDKGMQQANFQVDPRLATLLGQDYSTTEKALKELIDNAWDADAHQVTITLPAPLSDAPIVVQDDGNGMTRQELEFQYMKIASDRRVRAGGRTRKLRRQIKGKKRHWKIRWVDVCIRDDSQYQGAGRPYSVHAQR